MAAIINNDLHSMETIIHEDSPLAAYLEGMHDEEGDILHCMSGDTDMLP